MTIASSCPKHQIGEKLGPSPEKWHYRKLNLSRQFSFMPAIMLAQPFRNVIPMLKHKGAKFPRTLCLKYE
jgi:hypothetical protein